MPRLVLNGTWCPAIDPQLSALDVVLVRTFNALSPIDIVHVQNTHSNGVHFHIDDYDGRSNLWWMKQKRELPNDQGGQKSLKSLDLFCVDFKYHWKSRHLLVVPDLLSVLYASELSNTAKLYWQYRSSCMIVCADVDDPGPAYDIMVQWKCLVLMNIISLCPSSAISSYMAS